MKRFAAFFLILAFLMLTLVLGGAALGQDAGDSVTLHLIRDNEHSLTLYNPSGGSLSLVGLELRVLDQNDAIRVIVPASDFDALILTGGAASANTCYIYELNRAAPPTSSLCSQAAPVKKLLPQADVFWYDFNGSLPRDIALWRDGQFTGTTCPGNVADCLFSWSPIPPTFTPSPMPTPAEPVIPNGFSNLGEIQPQSLENILNQTSIQAWTAAGWTGAGQRVGVIDHHFGDIASLPFPVMTKDALGDYDTDNLTSGRDVLEVIRGVAPGAELFACRYAIFDEFQGCVAWMIEQQVTVINHAAGAPVLRLDENSGWSQAVNTATGQNIVWVEAAGNFAAGHRIREFRDNDGDGLHEFRGITGYNEVLAFAPIQHQSGTVMLAWESSTENPVDLDLIITDPATGLKITDTVQSGAANPDGVTLEYATFNMDEGFGVQIRNVSGRALDENDFSLYVEFAGIPDADTRETITAPGDSAQALTIAVLQGARIAPYSSQGPAGSENKPDLAAPGEIQLADGRLFIGSSASAALVSGFAALIREAYPNDGQEEIQDFVLDFATYEEGEFQGPDQVYGKGILVAPAPLPRTPEVAIAVVPTIEPAPLRAGEPVAVVRESSVNLRSGPGTAYQVEGYAYLDDAFTIVGQAFRNSWFVVEAENGQRFWLAASVVDVVNVPEDLPVATFPPAPTQPPPPNTPTFEPPPPRPLDAPAAPGNVRLTPTRRPLPAGVVTPLVTATPNQIATRRVVETATQYAGRLTATATGWTATYTPSPTVNLTLVSATPTATMTVTHTPTRTPSPTNTVRSAIGGQSVATNTPINMPTNTPAQCVPTKPASWSGWVIYTIRSGDTLGQLAVDTGTSVAAIMTANCLSSSNILAGNPLYLPKQPPPPPDSDGDGAPDSQDQCPNQAGPASNNYCPSGPDRDGDGAPDSQDECPDQAGPASNNFCPIITGTDSDGDGAPNTQDPCPNEAGPASNNYCPLPPPPLSVTINSVNGLAYVAGVGCQADVSITVSGGSGSVQGQFRVRHANYDDTYPTDTFSSGGKQVTLGGRNPGEKDHEVWIEYDGGSSNHVTASCSGFPYPS